MSGDGHSLYSFLCVCFDKHETAEPANARYGYAARDLRRLRTRTTMKAHQLGKKFSLEFHAKSNLFGHFLCDATDWYLLYKHSTRLHVQTMSIMTKQFVMLRMAMECVLKAILIGLSPRGESAQDAYSQIRCCGHNLSRLIRECRRRSRSRYRIALASTLLRIQQTDVLGIGVRYDADMKTAYKRQSFIDWATGTGPVSGVIIDEGFHRATRQDYFRFVKLAKRVSKARLHCYQICSGERISEVDDYIGRIVASPGIPADAAHRQERATARGVAVPDCSLAR